MVKFFLLILFLPFALFATTITEKNWYTHPKIVKIREEFKSIEKSIKAKSYQTQKKSWSGANVGEEITLYRDKKGKIKKLFLEGGSEDSYHKGEYFYKDGKLFFSYVLSRNYANCSSEIRSYFNNSKLIFRKTTNSKKCSLIPKMPWAIHNPLRYYKQFDQEPDDE